MHDYFAKWLGGVNVGLTDALAKSRWKAVNSLTKWANQPGRGLLLSLAAVSIEQLSEQELSDIQGVLQRGDSSISMINNHAEVQALAASSIVQLFNIQSPVADVAALCVATGTFGDRDPETAPELRQVAENFLLARAIAIRTCEITERKLSFSSGRKSAISRKLNAFKSDLTQGEEDVPSEEGFASAKLVRDLCRVVSELADDLREVAKAERNSYLQLGRYHSFLSEESDILWWIMSDFSHDLRKSRSGASVVELTLPSARELAHLIANFVPPAASKDFLRHAYSRCTDHPVRSVSIANAILATPVDWRASVIRSLPASSAASIFPNTGFDSFHAIESS